METEGKMELIDNYSKEGFQKFIDLKMKYSSMIGADMPNYQEYQSTWDAAMDWLKKLIKIYDRDIDKEILIDMICNHKIEGYDGSFKSRYESFYLSEALEEVVEVLSPYLVHFSDKPLFEKIDAERAPTSSLIDRAFNAGLDRAKVVINENKPLPVNLRKCSEAAYKKWMLCTSDAYGFQEAIRSAFEEAGITYVE